MSDWAKVRKLVRYLRKHPRQVLWFAWQDVQSNLQVYADTDYAGCPRTRRSTKWRSGHAREPLVEDLGFDTDRGGALER